MSIKQINASYLVSEDRILFRFNTQEHAEYRLWFTRRVTLFLLAASSHLLVKNLEQEHSSGAVKALDEFKSQAAVEAVKQQKPEQQSYESGTQFPIGAEPLLVMDISCSISKNEANASVNSESKEGVVAGALSIDFSLPAGANLNLKLPENMMRSICVLLDQLRQQAGWGEAILTVKNPAENTSENDAESDATSSEKTASNISFH